MQAEYLDRFSRGRSVVHRLDARWKILAAMALVATIVAMPVGWWYGHLAAATIVLSLFVIARLPLRYLLGRLALVFPFLLLVAAGVPLSRGFVDGFDLAAGILIRALLSLVVMITLVSTTPFAKLLGALERFCVPRILIWILAFMYRYIFVVADELARMRRAKQARSFGWNRRSEIRLLGDFVGVLFLRSFERGERVYAAMCARGWNGDLSMQDDASTRMMQNEASGRL